MAGPAGFDAAKLPLRGSSGSLPLVSARRQPGFANCTAVPAPKLNGQLDLMPRKFRHPKQHRPAGFTNHASRAPFLQIHASSHARRSANASGICVVRHRFGSIKKKKRGARPRFFFLAGPAGFEPADTGVKVLCLTPWRWPTVRFAIISRGLCFVKRQNSAVTP